MEDEISVTQQLLSYDPTKSNNVDDIIDACSMGITMRDCYMSEIMDQYQFMPEQFNMVQVLPN